MIYHIHTHNYSDSIPSSHAPLSINSLHSRLHLSLFQLCLLLETLASSLNLYLQVSCHFMCFVSLVLDIRFNALTLKFLTTSGTHNFGYGFLVLLQLQLHLLVLILKGKNTVSSLLTFVVLLNIHDSSVKDILMSLVLVNYNQKSSWLRENTF